MEFSWQPNDGSLDVLMTKRSGGCGVEMAEVRTK